MHFLSKKFKLIHMKLSKLSFLTLMADFWYYSDSIHIKCRNHCLSQDTSSQSCPWGPRKPLLPETVLIDTSTPRCWMVFVMDYSPDSSWWFMNLTDFYWNLPINSAIKCASRASAREWLPYTMGLLMTQPISPPPWCPPPTKSVQ